MRKAVLGVTRKRRWYELKEGSRSFWCVYNSHQTKPGDFVALYRPGVEVIQLHEIISDAIEPEVDCNIRRMTTVSTELRFYAENPVTFYQMKVNRILRRSGPVGRNFQATCFRLTDAEWKELLALLKENNPERIDHINMVVPLEVVE